MMKNVDYKMVNFFLIWTWKNLSVFKDIRRKKKTYQLIQKIQFVFMSMIPLTVLIANYQMLVNVIKMVKNTTLKII